MLFRLQTALAAGGVLDVRLPTTTFRSLALNQVFLTINGLSVATPNVTFIQNANNNAYLDEVTVMQLPQLSSGDTLQLAVQVQEDFQAVPLAGDLIVKTLTSQLLSVSFLDYTVSTLNATLQPAVIQAPSVQRQDTALNALTSLIVSAQFPTALPTGATIELWLPMDQLTIPSAASLACNLTCTLFTQDASYYYVRITQNFCGLVQCDANYVLTLSVSGVQNPALKNIYNLTNFAMRTFINASALIHQTSTAVPLLVQPALQLTNYINFSTARDAGALGASVLYTLSVQLTSQVASDAQLLLQLPNNLLYRAATPLAVSVNGTGAPGAVVTTSTDPFGNVFVTQITVSALCQSFLNCKLAQSQFTVLVQGALNPQYVRQGLANEYLALRLLDAQNKVYTESDLLAQLVNA